MVLFQLAIGRMEFLLQLLRERGRHDPVPDFLTCPREGIHIIDIQLVKHSVNTFMELICFQKVAVGGCSSSETVGNLDPQRPELTDHLPNEAFLPPTRSTSSIPT